MDALRKSVSSVKADDLVLEAPTPAAKKKTPAKQAEPKKGITLVQSETSTDKPEKKAAKPAARKKSA